MDKNKLETMIAAWRQEQQKAVDQVAYFKGAIEAAEHILAQTKEEEKCDECECCETKNVEEEKENESE